MNSTLVRPESIRVAAVLTHPTQYFSPWFQQLHADHPEVDFTAVYATVPSPDRQGIGFGRAFAWDVPLLAGYRSIVVRPTKVSDEVHSSRFFGVDAPILPTLKRLRPDVVLVCGWHSIFQMRTLLACRRLGIPALYRGDTTLLHEPPGFKGRLWALKSQLLLRLGFDGYLAVGTRSREYLHRMGVADTRVFASPHCVDNEYFARSAASARSLVPSPKARYGLQDQFVALFAGKLETVKRPADLLDALHLLGGGWAALFVGTGPLEASLKQEAERLGVRAVFAGFHNQSEMGRAYAAADVFVLPSQTETWGLAVNEALACGVPCIVSDGVGSAPDLINGDRTGVVFPRGDVASLAAAIKRVRDQLWRSEPVADNCRAKAETHSFAKASEGLVAAARAVAKVKAAPVPPVIAVCGAMSIVGGMERQTFQLLEALKNTGRPIHVIGNDWANWADRSRPHPIKVLADRLGATWRIGSYYLPLGAGRTPLGLARLLAEFLRVGRELIAAVQETGARTVLFPDHGIALRNMFVAPWLRWRGVRAVLRVGVAPERKRRYLFLWRHVLPMLVDVIAPNSEFLARRLREIGVPPRKVRCIKNAVAVSHSLSGREPLLRRKLEETTTLLCVGQIIPFKGQDVLLAAAEQLLQKGYDFHTAFLGREPDWPADYVKYFEALQATAQRPPLAGRVHFLGEVPNAQEVMKGAFLVVAPFVGEEAFGNVILEAIDAGVPCVVTPRGGLPELVDHKRTGFICREADADSLSEGIEWFLSDPRRRRFAAAACRQVVASPNWPYLREKYEAAWLNLFAELDGGPGPQASTEPQQTSHLRIMG